MPPARWIVLAPLLVSVALAGDFYPLQPGTIWVYAYHNVLAFTESPMAMTNVTDGTMTARVVALEVTNGVTYARTETTTTLKSFTAP